MTEVQTFTKQWEAMIEQIRADERALMQAPVAKALELINRIGAVLSDAFYLGKVNGNGHHVAKPHSNGKVKKERGKNKEANEAIAEDVLAYLKANEGVWYTVPQLAKNMPTRINPKQISVALKKMVKAGEVKSEGAHRAKVYQAA